MNRKLVTLTMVCLLLSAATGFAQVKLERKYVAGTKITSEVISNVDQTLTIAGNETVSKTKSHTTTETSIGKRGADGQREVKERIQALQIDIKGTNGDYRFDSAAPDKSGGSPLEIMRDLHKMMLKQVTTTIYGQDDRVVDVKSDTNALSKLPAQVQIIAKSQLDPKYLTEAANQTLNTLPSKPVKNGDSWIRTEKTNFGAGQIMQFETKYTYDGTIEKQGRTLDKISSKTASVKFTLAENSPLPIKLKGSKLKVKESKGTILFDRKLGRVIESKSAVHISGGMIFDANGMELPADLNLKMSADMKSQ